MATESFANNAFTSVYSGGTDAPVQGTTETWIVTSSASFPVVTSPATEFHVADPVNPSETIAVTNTSGVTWTVTRGAEGSTPVAHAAGFTVSQVVTAGWLNSIASSSDVNSLDWINVANAYGADPTGNNWSDGAFASAASAATFGTVLYVPYGTYKAQDTWTIAQPGVTVITDPGTVFNFWGPGDFFRMYSPDSYTSGWGGGLIGRPVIDGTHAPAGACGAHIGDIYQLQVDFGVRNFQGANSKGVWFDNQYWYAEDMSGRIWAERNTANVVFDHSANAGGNATGSFARLLLDIVLDAKGVGDGLVIQSDADLYGGRITYVGNMDYGTSQFSAVKFVSPLSYSFTATHASPCVFTATGSYYSNGTYVTLSGGSLPAGFTAQSYYVVSASGATFELAATSGGTAINSTGTGSGTVTSPASQIRTSTLTWDVECNATSNAYQPITINFGTAGANQIKDCTGLIDFSADNAFASAVNYSGSFEFDGPVYGDASLFRIQGLGQNSYFNGAITNGNTLAAITSLSIAHPASNVTGIILQDGIGENQLITVVNYGAGSIAFAAVGTSHVSGGTSVVIPSGETLLLQWIAANSTWYPAAALGQLLAAQPGWLPADVGWLAWNYDPAAAVNSTVLTGGQVTLIGINVRSPISCTNVIVVVSTAGNTLTSTENYAGLYNSAGTLIGTSADQTTAWASTGLMTMALASGPYTLPAGLYWVALVSNGTTPPAIGRGANNAAALVNGTNSAATSRYGGILTGQHSLPGSITPSSITPAGVGFFAALS